MKLIGTTFSQKLNMLRSNSYFQDLPNDVLEELAQDMELCRYEPGEVIFWEGDPCTGLFVISSGSVKLYKISPQGREFVLQTFGEDVTFNEVPVFDEGLNPVNVSALEMSEIWVLEPDAIRAMLIKHPVLSNAIIANLSHNLRMLVTKVEELTFCQVTHRLARLIDQLPSELLAGDLPARLTQDQIAARLGTVREVVGRSLRELERSGAIKVQRGRIQIVDSDVLRSWTDVPYY